MTKRKKRSFRPKRDRLVIDTTTPRAYWRVREVATLLNCGYALIREKLTQGQVPGAIKIGSGKLQHWRIPDAFVQTMLGKSPPRDG